MKTADKIFRPAFGRSQHPKAGWNTQHPLHTTNQLNSLKIYFPTVLKWEEFVFQTCFVKLEIVITASPFIELCISWILTRITKLETDQNLADKSNSFNWKISTENRKHSKCCSRTQKIFQKVFWLNRNLSSNSLTLQRLVKNKHCFNWLRT